MAWPDLPTALSFSCLIGTLSAYLAHKRGRNPYAWFFIGVFFGLLGMIAIFFAPSQKNPKPVPQTSEPTLVGPTDRLWYYLDETHQQIGPMSFDALNKSWKLGKVPPSSYLWNESLPDWKPLQDFIRFN